MDFAAVPTSRARSQLFDVLLALAVTALALGGSIGESNPSGQATVRQIHFIRTHQPGAAYAVVAVASLALIWRRRGPLAVLTVTVAACAGYAAAGYVPGAALTAVYVALYSVATQTPRLVAAAALVTSVVVIFVTTGAGGAFGWLGGTNTVMGASAIAATAIGSAVAGRRQLFATMMERAAQAERDREEDARRRVDAERLRIARELHDVVAHSMSMINVQANVASHLLSTQPEQAVDALAAIKTASREGLRELQATAKTHVSRILTKLGARDRTQLVVIAYETGLVIPGGRPDSSG